MYLLNFFFLHDIPLELFSNLREQSKIKSRTGFSPFYTQYESKENQHLWLLSFYFSKLASHSQQQSEVVLGFLHACMLLYSLPNFLLPLSLFLLFSHLLRSARA